MTLAYELAMAGASRTLAKGAGEPEGAEKTLRYWEGGARRVERAVLMEQNACGRALLRNLRGEWMSVPLSSVEWSEPPQTMACAAKG